jgi:LPXTG-motif cell wall-anchored protein
MGAKIAGGVLMGIVAVALIFTGIALAGYAITMALEPSLGVAGAAAVAALLMLFPVMCALVALAFVQAAAARRKREARAKETEEAIISLLSFLAGDRPWIAVAGAALVGAAGYFLRGRKK